jgi:hypothetical protein
MFPLIPNSFGDIVAASNLALTIYKALSDSTGSSFEYQCLIDELHSFHLALEYVDRIIRVTPLGEDVIQAINAEAGRCRELLDKFWDRVKSYRKALGGGGPGSSWRKIGWSVFKAEEVARFRAKLSARHETVTLFLTSLAL